jgi:UDP-N-acetylglucosamine 2-epimerase (hydrolysing)
LSSLRLEYFLVLLKNAKFIIGNSSAGVREAPYYRVPSINIGSRQNKRVENSDIINSNFSEDEILSSIKKALRKKIKHVKNHFGKGDSDKKFLKILNGKIIWQISKQKLFQDIL